MALSVMKDRFGPDWPLGLITVATSGTPVGIMKLVDSTSANAPQTATPTSSGAVGGNEYSVNCQQIIFQSVKSVAPIVNNTGALYILRVQDATGTGNKTDSGVLVGVVQPGQTFTLGGPPMARQEFSPYRYLLDADNSGDGAIVTLII